MGWNSTNWNASNWSKTYWYVVSVGGGGFPTQYMGLRLRETSATVDLCLVAIGDAPAGMGGVLTIPKNGVDYALYLVETSDPNASQLRIETTVGVKSVRLKT